MIRPGVQRSESKDCHAGGCQVKLRLAACPRQAQAGLGLLHRPSPVTVFVKLICYCGMMLLYYGLTFDETVADAFGEIPGTL
jgi:hypothetical protein